MNELLSLSLSTILAALPASPDAHKPIAKIETEVRSPITGLWRLELENENGEKITHCTEDYNFGADNQLLVVSDTEWTYGKYLFAQVQKEGMPLLILKTTFDNNNPDCSGTQKDQTGEQFMAYFKQEKPHAFELCNSSKGDKCFMRFNQILP